MGGKPLDIASIEPHARFYELQIELLGLSALDVLLLAFSIAEFSQKGPKLLIDLGMGIP